MCLWLDMQTSRIRVLIPEELNLGEEVEEELGHFNEAFTELQPDGIGMIGMEKAILRTYLLWRLHIMPYQDTD